MSWDSTLPILVRSAIGDTASPPKYADADLLPVILTAAFSTIFNVPSISSLTTYNIDVENVSLTPDPTDPSTLDMTFSYLVTLKASTMLLYSEVRKYGQQAIAIRDGTSAIDLKRDLKALTELANKYSAELDSAIYYAFRAAGELNGRMIVSGGGSCGGIINRLDGYFLDRRSYR
jgi:hypothetical protein